jgi:ACS family hexuronate transporter-like MFS transporter
MQQAIGKYRWTICALIFFATTINYLDRAVISLLKGDLEKTFHWSESDYSHIVIAFQFAYAIGLLFAGGFIDKIGSKIGYAISITAWSIAAICHAFAASTFGFGVARAFLGVTEAGNFPSAIKAAAEWFPKKERAFATGIFNSGSNIGSIIAPLTVPFVAASMGWWWAFILTGCIGFIWLILWFIFYEIPSKQKRLSKAEFDYIHSDADGKILVEDNDKVKISWFSLFKYKHTWAFFFGKFLTDPIWWFYLFWLPAFLKAQYGLQGTAVAFPVALVYTMSTIGSIVGGWLPMYFSRRGKNIFIARKTSMFIYALFALPVVFAQLLGSLNMWYAIVIIGIATAGHQAWSANIYTTVSDAFPKKVVGSVIGIGGMAGAIGGLLIAELAGLLLDHYKALNSVETGYYIMFIICGVAYLFAWLIMHLLVPDLKEIKVS